MTTRQQIKQNRKLVWWPRTWKTKAALEKQPLWAWKVIRFGVYSKTVYFKRQHYVNAYILHAALMCLYSEEGEHVEFHSNGQ